MRVLILVAMIISLCLQVQSKGFKQKKLWVKATGYCPCSICCGTDSDGKTSLGKNALKPGVAADPRAIPYGTLLHIPGYDHPDLEGKHVRVDDTGGAMRQSWRKHGKYHIDVRFKTHKEALEWGVKKLQITLLE